MAVQAIQSIMPMRVNQIETKNESNNIPKYRMAYIPTEFFDKYCSNGYCSGEHLNYLA